MPVKLIGIGEALEDLRPFDPDDFARALLEAVSEASGDGTRVVPPACPRRPSRASRSCPVPTFAAPFHLQRRPATRRAYAYGRYGNPTWTRYEAALGELEGGEAVVVRLRAWRRSPRCCCRASSPATCWSLPTDCYRRCARSPSEHLAPRGVEVRLGADRAELRRRGARARARLARVAVEPGPRGLRPRRAGRAERTPPARSSRSTTRSPRRSASARSSWARTSRWRAPPSTLSGHARPDARLRRHADAERAEALRDWRTTTGAIPGPFETWLAHRSLATLDVRLERAVRQRARAAELLAARADVSGVRYPGLPGDPAHALAAPQMTRFGTVVVLRRSAARERAERFLAAPSWSPRRRASAACTRPPSAARAGAATTCARASSACRRGCEDAADLHRRRRSARSTRRDPARHRRERLPRARARSAARTRSGISSRDVDIRDAAAVAALFERLRPSAAINTAYRHDDRATHVRRRGPRGRRGGGDRGAADAPSTDVVFDGEKGEPYTEDDEPTPLTDYGRAKADAERGVLEACPGPWWCAPR